MEDNSTASADDTVITLRNGWLLQIGNGCDWVRNGESWTITGLGEDGTATIRKTGKRFGSSNALPAVYLAQHVDLSYTVTAHQAQGITVDTAHIVFEPTSTPEKDLRSRLLNHQWRRAEKGFPDHWLGQWLRGMKYGRSPTVTFRPDPFLEL